MSKAPRIRVLLVEDHVVVREGLAAMMRLRPDFEVVGQAGTGEEGIELYRRLLPDVVLMDLRMPGMGGLAAIAALRAEFVDARIVVLTIQDGDQNIHKALQAGALGYLLKFAQGEEVWEAISAAAQGKRHLAAEAAAALSKEIVELTAREQQILELIVAGKGNKQIAAALRIVETTVKEHVTNILAKLGVQDRTQAATAALRRGLVK